MTAANWAFRISTLVLAVLLTTWSKDIVGYQLLSEAELRTGHATMPRARANGLEQQTFNDYGAGLNACRVRSTFPPSTEPMDIVIRPVMRLQTASYQYRLYGEIHNRVDRLGPVEQLHALLSARKRTGLLAEARRSAGNRFRDPAGSEAATRRLTRLAACGYIASRS